MPVGFETQCQPRKRFLTVPEMQRLLPQLTSKYAAVVAFIVATGADWSAVARATRDDVASDLTMCTIHGSKNRHRRDRLVPIATHEQRTLLGYALAHADGVGGALFGPWINVRRDLRGACARAGVPPVSPNDLRRTFGTWLRKQGVDPSLIAPAMGHADSRMVERVYGHLPPEDLRSQIAAAVSVHAGLLPVCSGNEGPCCASGSITGVSDGSKIDAPDGLGGLTSPQFPAGFVRGDGIEPPTRGFSIPCSTN
jgi:integrase